MNTSTYYLAYLASQRAYKGELSNMLLSNTRIGYSKDIEIEYATSDLLPGRHTRGESNTTSAGTFETKTVKNIPTIAEKFNIDENLSMQVAKMDKHNKPSEDIIAQHKYNNLASMVNRRIDLMTMQALTTKKVKDSDGNLLHEYERGADSTIASEWSNANTNPATSIDEAIHAMYNSGCNTSRIGVLFGKSAFSRFVKSNQVKEYFDNRTYGQENTWLPKLGDAGITTHGVVSLPGVSDRFTVLSYAHVYRDFDSQVSASFIDDNVALVFALDNNSGIKWFGSVRVNAGGSNENVNQPIAFDRYHSVDPAEDYYRAQSRFFPSFPTLNHYPIITTS